MRLRVGVATDIGHARDRNEDAYLAAPPLYIVADGMGGHKGGEVASALAVETVQEVVSKRATEPKLSARKIQQEAYREASSRIHHKSTFEQPELMGMGTTMVLLWEHRGRLYIGN